MGLEWALSLSFDLLALDHTMAQYDLTNVMAPYLDRHLVLPLLEHLQKAKVNNDSQLFSIRD